jgi:hypothetical protein
MITKFLQTTIYAFLAFALPQIAKADIMLAPLSQTVTLGSQATVDIVITGLGNPAGPPALSGYSGLVVSYDQTILQAASVTFSSRLGDPTDPSQTLLLSNLFFPGEIELDGVSFLTAAQLYAAQANPTASFSIATIKFDTIGAGLSGLGLSYSALSDEFGNPLTETTHDGSVMVTSSTPTVPEPGTWVLLTTVLCFCYLHRRMPSGVRHRADRR